MKMNFKTMGVVNITPDSFSDGGEFNSPEACTEHIQSLLDWGVDVLDFGAESTAPFNDALSFDEEIYRFEYVLFKALQNFNLQDLPVLSIDTYKPETFELIHNSLRELGIEKTIIWNDVSGVVDEKTLTVLRNVSSYKVDYVLSHTFVPSKDKTSDHLIYTKNDLTRDELFSGLLMFFRHNCELLETVLPRDQILLDPCFGFSKNFDQNWWLIEDLPALCTELNEHRFMVGVSKKSFLQRAVAETLPLEDKRVTNKAYLKNQSEALHHNILSLWKQQISCKELIIRLHDPQIAALSNNYLQLLGR